MLRLWHKKRRHQIKGVPWMRECFYIVFDRTLKVRRKYLIDIDIHIYNSNLKSSNSNAYKIYSQSLIVFSQSSSEIECLLFRGLCFQCTGKSEIINIYVAKIFMLHRIKSLHKLSEICQIKKNWGMEMIIRIT